MKRFLTAVVFAVTFFFFLFFDLAVLHPFYRDADDTVRVRINRGDNLRSAASKLESKGVIFSKYIFILSGRILGYQDEIIPGEYKFGNGVTNLAVLKKITDASGIYTYYITIPEGLNIRQIARLLQNQINLDSSAFVKSAFNDSLIESLDIEAENLEGFLFPDTYEFNISTSNTSDEIVEVMVNQFRKKVDKQLLEKISKQKKNLMEIITLASIIEAETRYEPEKKTIAGVYYNRLKRKMKLEADPTIQYVLPGGPKKRLLYSDLKYNSQYNTYLYRGLPPGPINNPGLSSIIAAIEPEKHKYLYFVASGDGKHRFAETFEEHKENIKLYKKYLQEFENHINSKK